MEKYKARIWINDIQLVSIERETDKSVFFKSRSGRPMQERKLTEGVAYFDSWNDAKEFLISAASKKMAEALKTYNYYEEEYSKVVSLQQKS